MANGYLNSSEGSFKTTIDLTDIQGTQGFFNSTLKIPLTLLYDPRMGSKQHSQSGYILGIESKLNYGGKVFSSTTQFPNRRFHVGSETVFFMDYPIEELALQKLENLRVSNLDVKVDITLTIIGQREIKLSEGTTIEVSTKFESCYGQLSFQIPQSQWLSLLTSLGFKTFEMVEIPAANEVIPEEYQTSLIELKEAQRYLMRGDYDKVVSHCRSALEPIRGRFPSLKNKIKAGLSNEWLDTINNATLEWLDKVFKFQADITNKTHHPPSIGHFSKKEAEAIYMLTVSTISVGGQIEPLNS